MRTFLFALTVLAFGCGNEGVNYDVRLGALDPPRCTGYMQLVDKTGYWRCEVIGGAAHVDTSTPGVVFLDLETTPGFFNRVRAVADGDGLSGEMLLDGDAVTFIATRQQE